MKEEKVLEVIATYRTKFESLGVGKVDYPHETFLDSSVRGLEHCHAMLDKMEGFVKEGRVGKAFRWLGFLQGILWAERVYTLSELTSHNRKDPE